MTAATQASSEIAAPFKRARAEPQEFRWTYKQYMKLVRLGLFHDRRVELLGGKIYCMAPQLDRHAASIILCLRAFQKAFGEGFLVRPQLPLQVDDRSCPEPDISVVAGDPRDYVGTGHPQSALLIVEISETTLRNDRGRKASRYARAGLTDYWIVNLIDRCVEVYRNPIADSSAFLGWRYADVSDLQPSASLTPLAASNPILISDLLP